MSETVAEPGKPLAAALRDGDIAAAHTVPAPADDWLVIACCVLLGTAGYAVYLGLPVILGALSDSLDLGAREIGWIASTELGGMFVASLLASQLVKQGHYRRIAVVGIALAVGSNVASPVAQAIGALLPLRFVAGIGSGLCYSTAIAALCLTSRPARNFSLLGVSLIVIGSLEMFVLPSMTARWGTSGVFGLLAAAYVVPALMLRALPSAVAADQLAALGHTTPRDSGTGIARLAVVCLAAIVCFNVASSGFWAYSERLGVSLGLTPRSAANVLTIMNLLSLGGCALAWWAARRWGQFRPQLFALSVILLVFIGWSLQLNPWLYVAGIAVFFEAWAMSGVLQMSTLSLFDVSGRYAALVPAAQGIGQSAGPFIAGTVLGWHDDYTHVLVLDVGFVAGALLLYAWVYRHLQRERPAIAHS